MSVEKLRQKIEATVHVRGKDIFCEASADNLYAAVDGLVDKLDRTIIRHKEKNLAQRHGAAIKHQSAE
jgi:putative sigma-54 modulation protein